MYKLDAIDFGRRVAIEKEIAADPEAPFPNAAFDDSGNFLLYPTLLGIKVVNLVTNRVVKMVGKVESSERFLRVALHQGSDAHRSKKLPSGPDAKARAQDPTLVCTAYGKQRLYLFTRREPEEAEDAAQGRDVFNERPAGDEAAALMAAGGGGGGAGPVADLPRGAVIHTNRGDIWIKLFPDEVSSKQPTQRVVPFLRLQPAVLPPPGWLLAVLLLRPLPYCGPSSITLRPPAQHCSARAPSRTSPCTPRPATTTASSSTG